MASVDTEYKRRRRKIWAVGGIAAVALYVGGAAVFDNNIEDDLERRVPDVLTQSGESGVTAKFSGQDGTLHCEQPLADSAAALDAANAVYGVRKVELAPGCADDSGSSGTSATSTPTQVTEAVDYKTVADVVTGDPAYAQLAGQLGDSQLSSTLSNPQEGPFTVFAPSNSAFGEVAAEQLAVLSAKPDLRDQLLGYHVVKGQVNPADLTDGATLETVTGKTLKVAGNGTAATVDGASLAGEPISAQNGLVYTIDKVLVPADLDLNPAQPAAKVSATYANGQITLNGVVPSAAQREALVKAATAKLGADKVVDNLTVDEQTGVNADASDAVAALATGMQQNLVKGEAGFDGTSLYVKGEHATDEQKAAMETIAERLGATATLQPQAQPDQGDAAKLEAALNAYVIANPILFRPGSAELEPASTAVLDKVAADIAAIGKINVVVEGHTDTDGDAATNKALSERRAAVVGQNLVARGVPADNVTSVGFGEEQPVVVNGAEDKAASRRVIFKLSPAN